MNIVNWERVARESIHPIRAKTLDLLASRDGREASPKEIAHELGHNLSTVSYHIGALYKQGLLELVRTRQVRGATEHFYRLAG